MRNLWEIPTTNIFKSPRIPKLGCSTQNSKQIIEELKAAEKNSCPFNGQNLEDFDFFKKDDEAKKPEKIIFQLSRGKMSLRSQESLENKDKKPGKFYFFKTIQIFL